MKITDLYEDDDRERVNFYIGLPILAVTAVVIALGIVKVKNELAMTRAYDRQAAALERIADVAEADRYDRQPPKSGPVPKLSAEMMFGPDYKRVFASPPATWLKAETR